MNFTIKQGMNQETLKQYPDNYFDSIVTDPPYGIEFLGKHWDKNTGAVETWEECFRVLKPGGHILAFSAARTYHNLATNIESVGFEIRDQLMWLYASGFPKAQDIGKAIQKRQGVKETKDYEWNRPVKGGRGKGDLGKGKFVGDAEVVATSPEAQAWSGWKTALKPAHEPIVMARKPFKGSAVDNVLKHGTGALNIDASRLPYEKDAHVLKYKGFWDGSYDKETLNPEVEKFGGTNKIIVNDKGRFPSNVLGEVKGGNIISNYQNYFYCPKVSRAERHVGFEKKPEYFIQRPRDENGNTTSETGPQILRKRDKANLDHIPTDPDGMLDKGVLYQSAKKGSLDHIPAPFGDVKGCYVDGERFAAVHQKLQGSLDHIPTAPGTTATTRDLLLLVGGKYVAEDGTLIDAETSGSCPGKMLWLPGVGKIFVHGLKTEVEKILIAQDRSAEIPKSQGNNHPTVKPVALMSYLVKLVTPEGGKVLDPFSGSGSTGMACVEHGFDYTGCELDEHYVEIATKRIEGWYKHIQPKNNYNELFEDIK